MIKKANRRRPKVQRLPRIHPMNLPQHPGRFYWTEWGREFDVYKRGRHLYVNPGVEVRISPFIAGEFRQVVK